MRRGLAVLLLVTLLSPGLVPVAGAHRVGSPIYVSFLLDRFLTPDLSPGETGTFNVTVTNTYPWNMTNINLRFEVYRYREIDVSLDVDATWTDGPSFVDEFGIDHGRRIEPPVPPMAPLNQTNISFEVVTYPETRHGSLTSQGSYFVRSFLDFDLWDGNPPSRTVMMSLGYFTSAQFDTAGRTCPSPTAYCEGGLNLTYLGGVQQVVPGLDHLDGFLPEGSFSLTERMPVWPFVAVGGVMVASLVFAVLFYTEENPGKYPRLARWWLSVKGKARGARPPRAR